jgi:hypothetical protein
MASTVFASNDFKPEQLNTFFLGIAEREEKIKVIRNWQKAITNGKVQKSKEEQIKGEFLDKFFGDVLGYVHDVHETEWNVEKEFKSISDNKKPDAALGFFDQNGKQDVRCVIEVKGGLVNLDKKQNRADFQGSAVDQAFSYVPRMPGHCAWVIVTNMIEIRFYAARDISRYESFMIPELLVPNNLQRFFFLLSSSQLFLEQSTSRIDQIFSNRQAEQKKIGVEFYKQYRDIRSILFANLNRENTSVAPRDLFRSTQKLIDRLIFIGFVRDLRLVSNVLNELSQNIKTSFRKDNQKAWGELKELFSALNDGYTERNIPPFNGELFKPDPLLDSLTVRDHQLMALIKLVQDYDFQSQLDVNILGHIFEQSIADLPEILDEIQKQTPLELAELKTETSTTTKRKKDGIFYTPDYITRYMVKEAVGGWLEDRKQEILSELNLTELPEPSFDDYASIKLVNEVATGNEVITLNLKFWNAYAEKLQSIKVLDPACGSGAFLNQVFDFLYNEWSKVVNPELKKLTTPLDKQMLENSSVNEPMTFTYGGDEEWKLKKSIILNNIFGVDLNGESVEITKLSLWLKTANKINSLAALYDNIKQGNSLIDDPAVAGDDAFDWNTGFPEIMKAGGFDVVVGNPPYGILISKGEIEYFKQHYPNTTYKTNLYVLFIERMFQLFSRTSVYFIIPKSLLFNSFFATIRELLLKRSFLKEAFSLSEKIFVDAEVGDSLIIGFEITDEDPSENQTLLKSTNTFQNYLEGKAILNKREQGRFLTIANNEISISKENNNTIIQKLNGLPVIKDFYELKNGLNPGNVKHILIDKKKKNSNYKKIIWGRDLNRYSITWSGDYINYDLNLKEKLSSDDIKSKEGMNKQNKVDFALRSPDLFETEKICVRKTSDQLICSLDEERYYFDTLIHGIYAKNSSYSLKYLLGILNSKPATYFYRLLL